MATQWKLSSDGKSASRTNDIGHTESRLVSAIDATELANALPADIVSVQADQIAMLEAAYVSAIQVPVVYMNTTFQADEASQARIAKELSAGTVPAVFYWLDALNVKIPMTFAQLQGLAAAIQAQRQPAFDRLQTRKASVRTAMTTQAIKAVVW